MRLLEEKFYINYSVEYPAQKLANSVSGSTLIFRTLSGHKINSVEPTDRHDVHGYSGQPALPQEPMQFMVFTHFTMRTHGVNQAFRLVEDIWLHRKSHQIRFFWKETLFTSYVRIVK